MVMPAWFAWWQAVVAGVVLLILITFAIFYWLTDGAPKFNSNNKHVIVTGGSSGIGLATAELLAAEGAHVTILARNQKRLDDAVEVISKRKISSKQRIIAKSVDVTDIDKVRAAIDEAVAENDGACDALITSAGASRPGRFDEVDVEKFKFNMDVNYLGSVYPTLAVLPYMKQQRSGRIMFVGSMAGMIGVACFSAYTPSKFAIRGLAECLQMELRTYGIYVTLVNPPDVETPMLAEEMQWKPEECALISGDGGLFQAVDIAEHIMSALHNWKFMINTGLDGWLTKCSCTSPGVPSSSVWQLMVEFLLAGTFRIVGLMYLRSWHKIVDRVRRKREKNREIPMPGQGSIQGDGSNERAPLLRKKSQ